MIGLVLIVALTAPGHCERRASMTCADLDPLFRREAGKHGLPWRLVRAVAWRESRCNPCARSRAGALGVMQFIPRTAAQIGAYIPLEDPHDPAQSIAAGAWYLAALLSHFGGDVVDALAAYNCGPHTVRAGRVPPETRRYVADILERFHALGGQFQ